MALSLCFWTRGPTDDAADPGDGEVGRDIEETPMFLGNRPRRPLFLWNEKQ